LSKITTMAKGLTYKQITNLQKGYRVTATQEGINTGQCWLMEGSVGRFASAMLDAGVCMLPLEGHYDYYSNYVPTRKQVKAGTKGSFKLSQQFWQKVWDGDFDTIEQLENTFGRDEEKEVP
jgi:hypothetical protein